MKDFDLTNISVVFDLEAVEKPVKTVGGNLPLLISYNEGSLKTNPWVAL